MQDDIQHLQWQCHHTGWLAQPNTCSGRLGTPEVHALKWFRECALG